MYAPIFYWKEARIPIILLSLLSQLFYYYSIIVGRAGAAWLGAGWCSKIISKVELI